ncbi:hypothetical protein L6452_16832 [Arctium lappa]|uniref:Uncharacterized protein n=1 Tax=Arctium lappa TaxID=4217 RepID=A0ACB9C1V2_ARCLA|nr:hypothetical protein L6452_16832 [Arctium lappa]
MLSSLDLLTLSLTLNLPTLPTVDHASSLLSVLDVVFTGVEGEERKPEVMALHGAVVALDTPGGGSKKAPGQRSLGSTRMTKLYMVKRMGDGKVEE